MDDTSQFYFCKEHKSINNFNCGYEKFNEYISLKPDSSVMYFIVNAENDDLMAYFSLNSSAVLIDYPRSLDSMSAIEIKMFAIDVRYQGKRFSYQFIKQY